MSSLNLKPTLKQKIAWIFDIDLQSDKESRQIIEQMRNRVWKLIWSNYLEEIIYQIGYWKTIFSDENMKNKQMPVFIKTHLELTTNEEKEILRKIVEGLKLSEIHQIEFVNYCRKKSWLEIEEIEEIDTIQLDHFLELLRG